MAAAAASITGWDSFSRGIVHGEEKCDTLSGRYAAYLTENREIYIPDLY